jgi:hypothetical protein
VARMCCILGEELIASLGIVVVRVAVWLNLVASIGSSPD